MRLQVMVDSMPFIPEGNYQRFVSAKPSIRGYGKHHGRHKREYKKTVGYGRGVGLAKTECPRDCTRVALILHVVFCRRS